VSFWRWPRGLQGASLGALLLALFGWQVRNELAAADRRVGFALEEKDGGVVVAGVAEGGPAQRAGVRPGDRLLEVAGVKVRAIQDYDRLARRFPRGQEVRYLVVREGKELVLALRPGTPPDTWTLGLNAAGATLYLLLALLVLGAPSTDPRQRPLVLFAFAVALEFALPRFPFGPAALDRAREVFFYGLTGWQLALELRLVSLIPRRALWLVRNPAWERVFVAAGAAVALLLAATSLLFPEAVMPFPAPYPLAAGLLNFLVLPAWAASVVAILLRQVREAPSPLGRQQALLVLLGSLPWVAYIVASDALQLAGASLPSWTDYVQSLCLLVFPLAVFVAVFRYSFLDFEHLVRRSLLYTAVTGTVLLLFYALVGVGSALLSEWIGGQISVLVVSAATLALGVLFSPLRAFLQKLIDQRFFPERYAQRQRLVQLAAELPSFGKVQPMASRVVQQVAEIFACPRVTLLLRDPGSKLLLATASTELDPERSFDSAFLLAAEDPGVQALAQAGVPMPAAELGSLSGAMAQRVALFGAQWVVPVVGPRELVGMLLLGGREGSWSSGELELLSLLGHHVGTVLENARLFEAATVDGLTGLWRRETVLEYLEREWQRAKRYNRPLAVVMADVDLFKPINDRYGHLVGDAVLKWVALTLKQGVRASDLVGRYGGEEFLMVFPETDEAGAKLVAEKLRQRVEEGAVPLEAGASLRVTVSMGVAAFEPGGSWVPATPRELVGLADARLLEAKNAGRNRVKP